MSLKFITKIKARKAQLVEQNIEAIWVISSSLISSIFIVIILFYYYGYAEIW